MRTRLLAFVLLPLLPLTDPMPAFAQGGFHTITGMAWRDYDSDGIRDPDEAALGISDLTVELWNADATTLGGTTTTNASGDYGFSFFAPAPAAYRVRVAADWRYEFSPMYAASNATIDSDFHPSGPHAGYSNVLSITPNIAHDHIDAGLDPIDINVGNFAWLDLDGNGVQDANEPGYPDITVEIWDPTRSHLYHSVTSDDNGNYAMLAPGYGSFRLHFSLPAVATFSPRHVGSNVFDSDAIESGPDAGWTEVYDFASNLISIVSIDAGYQVPHAVDAGLEYTNVPSVVFPGSTTSWTLWVREKIGVAINSLRVRAPVPAGIGGMAWSCTAQGTAVCPASGSGAFDLTVALPADSALRIDFSGQVMSGNFATIAVGATTDVSGPQHDPIVSDNTAVAELRNDHLYADGFEA